MSRHTLDAEHRYRRSRPLCQIAVFKPDGTFYKGSRYTTSPIIFGHHPMTFTLPNLPYSHDALAPHMSKETPVSYTHLTLPTKRIV